MLFNRKILLAVAWSCMSVAMVGFAAASDASVAKEWGFIGLWKENCSAPATFQDPRRRHFEQQGQLYTESEWDDQPAGKALSQISDVIAKSDSSLEYKRRGLRMEMSDGRKAGPANFLSLVLIVKEGANRIRVYSEESNNTPGIVDGIILRSNSPTKWMNPCR